MNVLEELIAEWYTYKGYFIRRNVRVGKLPSGGYEGELDIIAYNPENREIIHIETSMDARSWKERKKILGKKFSLSEKYISEILRFNPSNCKIRKIAVIGFPRSSRIRKPLGEDIEVVFLPRLIKQIASEFINKKIEESIVPETYPLLRAIQIALDYGRFLNPLRKKTKQ